MPVHVPNPSSRLPAEKNRNGTILVLTALLLVPLCGFVALAIDVGYLCLVRTQLQAAADAGALAGADVMYPPIVDLETTFYALPPSFDDVRQEAQNFVKYNGAGMYKPQFGSGPHLQVDLNHSNDPAGDIVVGYLGNPNDLSESLTANEENPNAVLVRIPMRAGHPNGPLSLFFAPVLGISTADAQASAVAVVEYPTLLPIVTSEAKWNSISQGGDGDSYGHSEGGVTSSGDGIPEITIFPGQWNGDDMPPGNFGTVQIGPRSGTGVLRAQIDAGPSQSDLRAHGGSLYQGTVLYGETGISVDIQTALSGGFADGRAYAGILGELRWMPVYQSATGNGSNAAFTISRFVLVRVMAADLRGQPKRVVVQPATQEEPKVSVFLAR